MAKKKKETQPNLPTVVGPPLALGPSNGKALQSKTFKGPFNSGLVFGDVVSDSGNGRGIVYAVVLKPAPGFLIAYHHGCVLEQSPACLNYIGSIFDL